MLLVPHSNGEDNAPVAVLWESNDCHNPAGAGGGQFCSGGSGGGYDSFEAFAAHAKANLLRTSRTAKGVSDTSASKEKQKLTAEGKPLAEQTERNFQAGLQHVWQAARAKGAVTPEAMAALVDTVSHAVNEGLLQPGQSILRGHTTKYPSTAPADIPKELQGFAAELAGKINAGGDPRLTAAWVEKRFENIHPLADAVGRATKLLSAYVLLRAGQKLPTYKDRDSYYGKIGPDKPMAAWLDYYKGLF